MVTLLPDGTKQIELGKSQFERIGALLSAFYRKTKCGVVMLSDESGLAVAQSGKLDPAKMSLLSTLAAGNYAATVQMATLVEETSGFTKQFHEGQENSIYITGITDTFFLVVVFSRSTTFGMIRVLAEKLVKELREILEEVPEESPTKLGTPRVQEQMGEEDFRDELSLRLDSILGGKSE